MRKVTLTSGNWRRPAFLATGPLDRLLGRHRISPGAVLILATRSVHSFFEKEPMQVVVVDGSMRVERVELIAPRRLVFSARARFLVELPPGDAPQPGSILEIVDG